jgi:hypothetical protein
LDLDIIIKQLATGTTTSYATAKAVYERGAFSQTVAILSLAGEVLNKDIPKNTPCLGKSTIGKPVTGRTVEDYKVGDSLLKIQYDLDLVEDVYDDCRVGANPDPITDGCE